MSTSPGRSLQLARQEPLAEQAYRALREQIATGELDPGQRLTERGLADWLGVSATPVREALRRLEQEGLIERTNPRTLSVVAHSDEVLRELLFARVVLRAALARFAADKITDQQIAELSEILTELQSCAETAPEEELLAIGARFDAVIVQAADSPAVQRLIDSAAVIGPRPRLRAVVAMRGPARDIGVRHLNVRQDIIDALAAHDADRVERLVRDHLLSSNSLLLASEAMPMGHGSD